MSREVNILVQSFLVLTVYKISHLFIKNLIFLYSVVSWRLGWLCVWVYWRLGREKLRRQTKAGNALRRKWFRSLQRWSLSHSTTLDKWTLFQNKVNVFFIHFSYLQINFWGGIYLESVKICIFKRHFTRQLHFKVLFKVLFC